MMRQGQNLAYSELKLEEKAERFTTNTIKRMIEYDFQQRAERFGINLENAISLSGPAIGDHQFILQKFDNVIFPEINKQAYWLMLAGLRGNNRKYKSYSAVAWGDPRQKRKHSTESGATHPHRTEIRFANFFDVFAETHEFGLVDFDGIERPSQSLLDRLLPIIQTNTIQGVWALRLTVCLRGNKYDPVGFIRHISKAIPEHSTVLDLFQRSYCETHSEKNQRGAPMLTIQWVIKNGK